MKKHASVLLALSVFAFLIVLSVNSSVKQSSGNRITSVSVAVLTGSPLPTPTPPGLTLLTVTGSPLPTPTPPGQTS